MNTPPKDSRSTEWDIVLSSRRSLFELHLADLWRFRDLFFLFIRRDFVALYKQTILGPVWYVLEPLATTAVFTIVFGKIANISTEGVPHVLYYLSGTILWSYFAESFRSTGNTFVQHAGLFEKVYFPRLIVPLASVTAGLIKFGIQFCIFLMLLAYFGLQGSLSIHPTWIALSPLIVLQVLLTGLACGLIISSLTARYRDLFYLVGFATQLWMYATPIVYPLSVIPEAYRPLYLLNPVAAMVESFRFAYLGIGSVDLVAIGCSWLITLIMLLTGLVLFHRTAQAFIDTV